MAGGLSAGRRPQALRAPRTGFPSLVPAPPAGPEEIPPQTCQAKASDIHRFQLCGGFISMTEGPCPRRVGLQVAEGAEAQGIEGRIGDRRTSSL